MVQSPVAAAGPPARSSFGGYRLIRTELLLHSWRLYRVEKRLRFMDFRVYLALHEIDERRSAAAARRRKAGRAVRQGAPERSVVVGELLLLLNGATGRNVRAALRRLERAGLVKFDAFDASSGLRLADPVPVGERSVRLEVSVAKRRNVIVPRRVLRYLARDGSPAEAAVMLGQCMRCLFRHGKVLKSEGSCSASFVACVFAVHLRTVKRIRTGLHVAGWLVRQTADHWHVQAHGSRGAINLAWSPPSASAPGGTGSRVLKRSPRKSAPGAKLSPPESKRSLTPQGNHTPGATGPDGVRKRMKDRQRDGLGHVTSDDLSDDRRLEHLFERTVSAGLVKPCEADRLRFYAAAERARAVGRRNPPGFFAAIVRRGLWQVLTQGDENSARQRLVRVREGAASGEACGGSESGRVQGLVAELAGRFSAQSSAAAVVTARIDGGRQAGNDDASPAESGARRKRFRFPGRMALSPLGRVCPAGAHGEARGMSPGIAGKGPSHALCQNFHVTHARGSSRDALAGRRFVPGAALPDRAWTDISAHAARD